MGATIQTMQGHIVTGQGGGTFLIQGSTMDGEGTPLTHTTRASPATVSLIQVDIFLLVSSLSYILRLLFMLCYKNSYNHFQPTGDKCFSLK